MKSQIFKKKVEIEILINLLEKISNKKNNYYLLNQCAFKKGLYNNEIKNFLDILRNYYYTSKMKYIEKAYQNYNGFSTIIRQICKSNNLQYTSKIQYERSCYEIIHFIYI